MEGRPPPTGDEGFEWTDAPARPERPPREPDTGDRPSSRPGTGESRAARPDTGESRTVRPGTGESRAVRGDTGEFEFGTTDVTDEEGIARENGVLVAVVVGEQYAYAIRGVAGGVDCHQGIAIEFQGRPVIKGLVRVGGLDLTTHQDRGSGGFVHFQVTGYEIRVRVGLNDGDQLRGVAFHIVVVGLRIPCRIDHYRPLSNADHVRSMGQSLVIKLLDVHGTLDY